MKQVLIKQGEVQVAEVPAPEVAAGSVLVKVARSCISPGTEAASISRSSESLLSRALHKPDKAKTAMELLLREGWSKFQVAIEAKQQGTPTGYSAAGTVHELGSGVKDLAVGDRVACAGAQFAYHAEWISVPRNLVTRLPTPVSFDVGSTVALGAIALQGVRRTAPTLGEIFVVFGLGAIGQITVQLLKANGCRVIAMDLNPDRARLAASLGADFVFTAESDVLAEIRQLTDGYGSDGAVVTASTPSDSLIAQAFQVCRKKGRVVLVGDVGLGLRREDLYEKEIDFLISTSYGPGRYDRRYEVEGMEYPISYVRWTENCNMGEYLRLCAEHKLEVEPLITVRTPVQNASQAYAQLQSERSHLMALLTFNENEVPPDRLVLNPKYFPKRNRRVRIALLGAGEFARAVHLPNLHTMPGSYEIYAVASRSGLSASQIAQQFGAKFATTDYDTILSDPEIDAVLISTRHDLHAEMTLRGLAAGKHVLVEKPLALSRSQLDSIEKFFEAKDVHYPLLLTGFNRRHSIFVEEIAKVTSQRQDPMIINYVMNAGSLPKDHWVYGAEGGGRNLGEACHIYDLFTFLTQSHVVSNQVTAIRPVRDYLDSRDNFVANFLFEDGSLASLTYTSTGSKSYQKETMQIFLDGKVITLNDYRELTGYGCSFAVHRTRSNEKGHRKELEVFAAGIRDTGTWPIPLWQQVQATRMALDVDHQLAGEALSKECVRQIELEKYPRQDREAESLES